MSSASVNGAHSHDEATEETSNETSTPTSTDDDDDNEEEATTSSPERTWVTGGRGGQHRRRCSVSPATRSARARFSRTAKSWLECEVVCQGGRGGGCGEPLRRERGSSLALRRSGPSAGLTCSACYAATMRDSATKDQSAMLANLALEDKAVEVAPATLEPISPVKQACKSSVVILSQYFDDFV